MTHTKKTSGVIGVLLSLLLVVACSSPTPAPTQIPTSTPTLDLNPVRTEAAATVWAQVTQNLALTPSPTYTPSPTLTATPTLQPQQVGALPGVTVTLSLATPVTPTLNLAQWVSQSIADETVFAPNTTFTITWVLKNVGKSSWTAGYMLRFFSGEIMGAPKEIVLDHEVRPGETAEFAIRMKTPSTPGDYRTDWVMATEGRSNFKESIYLKITVALPPTATRAPTIAPTATP